MATPTNPFEPTPTPTPTTEPDLKSLRVYSNDDPSGSTIYKVSGAGGSSSFDLSDRMAKGSATGAVVEGNISGDNANIANSTFAHAEGSGTVANGLDSHAEGSGTTASGNQSHAEGSNTSANGDSSHAEGHSAATNGNYSHAEGTMTNADGQASHAEGLSAAANGNYSHAEGSNTSANGDSSHAEGNGTKAAGKSEHVFGEYNVTSNPSSANYRSAYVEIVGNGTGENARSNARTLDWSGNESLSGSITLGMGTANEVTLTAGDLRALLGLLSNS